MKTSTARTMKLMRDRGWTCQVVETFNPWARVRNDLFGIFDVLAIRGNAVPGVMGIQSTVGLGSHLSERIRKIAIAQNAKTWMEMGGRIQVHAWRKLKLKRGGKAYRWVPSIHEFRLENGIVHVRVTEEASLDC